ncbi:probable protein phosphatase 2C 6 isoform X1 [Typha latifolia]|uniref:probable protein phosphatase 2C 6 isoform X1 n=1 Tax=Typha latifolia TaxID=4733 RepID=UPI003C2AFA17
MEKRSGVVTLSCRVSNLLSENLMEINHLNLITDAAALLPDQVAASKNEEEEAVVAIEVDGDRDGSGLKIRTRARSEDEDSVSAGLEFSVGSPCSVVSDCSSIASVTEEFLNSDMACELGTLCSADAVKSTTNSVEIEAGSALTEIGATAMSVGDSDGLLRSVIQESRASGSSGGRSVFLMDYVPLWGCTSICGRRPEMEDAAVTVPRFFKIPLRMLTDSVVNGLDPSSFRLPAHFFGVYDGHGGAQVANYCRDRLHVALVEELSNIDEGLGGTNMIDFKNQWERAFVGCFQKVDDEVGGKAGRAGTGSTSEVSDQFQAGSSEPVAPETVGSTAVVAVICSSHIIVANCGDSRAVLCRGKQPVPLSVDHKPDREDEYARIEAEGGKVIQWNGYRVLGVLAMSRSIGDRYLKPWIIPVPEVTIVPRAKEDDCLILASDGLWDVLSNEEVCDVARKRILIWHKNNGTTSSSMQRGDFTDPAAQAASDYLSKLALQKGSKDNITVIVVDLKAHRKFKSKT